MAVEGTYEYECMRAELLGIEKPDYEEFMKNKAEKEAAEREALEAETMRESQIQNEEFQQIGGKLEELNNILKSTQKRINNFAAPFSNFLKFKMGLPKSDNQDNETLQPNATESQAGSQAQEDSVVDLPQTNQSSRSSKQMTSFDPSKIDNLIDKFDRAHGSMEFQSKQMKKVLK